MKTTHQHHTSEPEYSSKGQLSERLLKYAGLWLVLNGLAPGWVPNLQETAEALFRAAVRLNDPPPTLPFHLAASPAPGGLTGPTGPMSMHFGTAQVFNETGPTGPTGIAVDLNFEVLYGATGLNGRV